MKNVAKIISLGLGCALSLSLLAGCGGGEDDLPTPDKTVSAFSDQAVTLALDGTAEKTPISESLFGIFLEDINHAGYLLDDNLLLNGSFETFEADKALGWSKDSADLTVKSGEGVLSGVDEYAAKGVNANYAEVKVTAAGGGIANKGPSQIPIAVAEGKDYLFSAFVKASEATEMTVRIKDSISTYAEGKVDLKAGEWVKYQLTLKASATATSDLSLEMRFDAAGTYLVDGVQLETLDATVGIKQYVYDAIKELSPKFIRFPGGCIIEGDADSKAGGADTTEVYDWKNSVGAVQNGENAGDDTIPAFGYTLVKDGAESKVSTYGEWVTRRQNGDLWGYDMEYGVGFYEYFMLSESVGASALPVLNCGMSDQGGAAQGPKGIELNGRHGKKVEDYIQDAIDLIEFAKGGTETKWGALRAALGHEAPFKMDYLGIGNEQSGEYYTKYYEKFLADEDFKAALSTYGVKPIVGNGMFLSDCRNTSKNANGDNKKDIGTAQQAAIDAVSEGVVENLDAYGVHDQHYYVNWTELLDNYNMYDEYSRPGSDDYYGVFVGEYSANEGESRAAGYPLYPNSMITALSEAAMMTAYERNGDVVKLAAYAPMFGIADVSTSATKGGKDTSNNWAVDMMYYTNTTIVRTANYYVQQMFMNNQGHAELFKSRLNWTAPSTFTFAAEGGAKSKEFEKLYFDTTLSEEGDILVKVVNVSSESIKMNIDITNAESRGFAYVTELASDDYKALNTLRNEKIKPALGTIGWSGQSLGYELKPYSVTVLRILTK